MSVVGNFVPCIPLCFTWTLQYKKSVSKRCSRVQQYLSSVIILLSFDFLPPEFMNEDEKNLYEKLSEMLQEEDTSTVIDLPGNI